MQVSKIILVKCINRTQIPLKSHSPSSSSSSPFLKIRNPTPISSHYNSKNELSPKSKRPVRYANQNYIEFNTPHFFHTLLSSADTIAQQLMLHNQEIMSQPGGDIPLYKQSYPGLYSHGGLKQFEYEATIPVTHGYMHHGKQGYLFLVQDHPGSGSGSFDSSAHNLHLGSYN